MALVEQPITHFIKAIDQQGLPDGLFEFRIQTDGFSSVTADIFSNNLLANFQAVSRLKVIEVGYTTTSQETDLTPPTDQEAGEQKLTLICSLVRGAPGQPGQNRYGQITIPGPRNELFVDPAGDGNNQALISHTAIQEFLQMYEQSALFPRGVISDFQHIQDPSVSGNVRGKRQTRGRRRG